MFYTPPFRVERISDSYLHRLIVLAELTGSLQAMKSFILHVYSRGIIDEPSQADHGIIGMVQSFENERKIPFTTLQELWEIVAEQSHEKNALTSGRKKGGALKRD